MADKVPLKGLFDNSGNVTGLAEYRSADGDTLGVIHGGTGLATVATDRILTGNGTSAMTAEANLTFDGTTLTVTGNIVATGNFEAQTQITTVDPVLLIDSGRSGNPATTDDAGIIIERGSDPNVSICWDESEQHFSFATTTDTGAGTDNTISVSQETELKTGSITSTGNIQLTGTLQFDSGQTIDAILIDTVGHADQAFVTSTASETKLVTEKAVKTHVSAQASAFAIALG